MMVDEGVIGIASSSKLRRTLISLDFVARFRLRGIGNLMISDNALMVIMSQHNFPTVPLVPVDLIIHLKHLCYLLSCKVSWELKLIRKATHQCRQHSFYATSV